MTDHSDLIARARAIAAYNGAGVHEDLRAAIRDLTDALSSQSLSLSEAREEIERLRDALKPLADRIDEIEQVKAVAKFAVEGTAAVKLELLRNARKALENGTAGLADAHTNPPLSGLSSLRKGAEVAALDVATRALNRIASRQESHPVSAAFAAMTEIRALVSGSREDGR